MIKCKGCGATLQNVDIMGDGYVKDLSMSYCERCFKITHYNDYKFSSKGNDDYLKIISDINGTDDLVLLVTDFLNVENLIDININNDVILVLSKRDLIPYNLNEQKLLSKIYTNLNVVSKIVVCSKNNYNLDRLMDLIYKYKRSNNVYVIGYTNAGKSTLINRIAKNYGENNFEITTSVLPSTTLGLIDVHVNTDLTLVDTPGLLDYGSVILNISVDKIAKILPKSEIKPRVIQVKVDQTILLDDFIRLDVLNGTKLVFYVSNSLKLTRIYKKSNVLGDLPGRKIVVDKGQDLVIKGLGFIKCLDDSDITIYMDENIKYMIRQSII